MNRLEETLLTVLHDVGRIRPQMATSHLHADDASLLTSIGFPTQFFDWFDTCEAVIAESQDWRGVPFTIRNEEHICGDVAVLVRQEVFPLVIEITSRAILFVRDDGTADLVNSGLYQFLFCVGCYLQSAKNSFVDAQDWLTKCKACDPEAFLDVNGAWAVLFEEAIAGMF